MGTLGRVCAGLVLVVALVAGQAGALMVQQAGYVAQPFITYTLPGNFGPSAMVFAGDGNLYVAHNSSEYWLTDGSIYKVAGDGSIAEQWVTNMARPLDICWGGGGLFGENLYVAEAYSTPYYSGNGGIMQVSLSGQKTIFCESGLNMPTALDVYHSDAYGNLIYATNGNFTAVKQVNLNGGAATFAYFGDYEGSPRDLQFDMSGAYGNKLYVGTRYSSQPDLSGILLVEPDGTYSRFATDVIGARQLGFDRTGSYFEGKMYAFAITEDSPSNYKLYEIDPSGELSLLADHMSFYSTMAFGPDGALYVGEYQAGNVMEITRIVPEPASMLLLAVGAAGVLRRRRRS